MFIVILMGASAMPASTETDTSWRVAVYPAISFVSFVGVISTSAATFAPAP